MKTCLSTMCRFVDSLVSTGKQLSRVAIYCAADKRHSCMRESKTACSTDETILSFGLNSLYGVQVDEHPNLRNGWPNLEEIILCVSFFPPVDESITFRPAKHIGRHYEKRHLRYFQSIQDLQSGQPQFAKWVPNNRPKFHFACLSKRAEPGKVFDLLIMSHGGSCTALSEKEYVNDMINLSNPHCQVRLVGPDWISSYHFELYGTEEGIFATKKACLILPGSSEEQLWGKIWRQITDDQWKEWNFRFEKRFLY
ncbi:8a74c325-e7bc-4a4a-a4ce-9a63943c8333 [Sclerotinia trifoliorum]|uniref:8a74c325-e7bc-4a4a-a4ce-9a63943c8333 n=1 Tax=Sclerotinia trifoliorum TaxID=28548 RepID=A0A8H2VLA6_9HELO|nr:8a74c325-e7bc-4a4a-a4ce-9a63943c8333 [Sclerotinia trifoliorum]